MKVYISVDMEGIGGVSHSDPTQRGDDGYPAAVALMVGEANAAVDGAFAGGATEVLINDSHGGMFNLTPEDVDPRAVAAPGPEAVVDGRRRGPRRGLRGGAVRRLPHPRGPPDGHDRAHLQLRPDADDPAGQAGRRGGHQRAGARRVGRAGRAGVRRRRGGEGNRRVVPMGRAGRRQVGGQPPRRRVRPSERRPGPGSRRCRARRPPGRGGRDAAPRPRPARSRSRPSTEMPARPTTPPSFPAPSASATAVSASSPTTRSSPTARSSPASGSPASSIDRRLADGLLHERGDLGLVGGRE